MSLLTSLLAPGNATYAGQVKSAEVVFIGDSIIHTSGVAEFTADTTLGSTAVVNWVDRLTHRRLATVDNVGVAGETIGQIAARIATDVVAQDPGICILIGGVNDVKGGSTLATIQSGFTSCFDALQSAGIYCITGTITPSDLIDTTAEETVLFQANRWLVEQGKVRPGLSVIDFYPLVANPASVDWHADLSSDFTHPNSRGAVVIGQAIADVVNALLPAGSSELVQSNADPDELLPNPMMTGNSSGLATSVTNTGGTNTPTKVARTDGVQGEWQQIVQTSGTNTLFQLATTGFSEGDQVTGLVEMWIDDAASLTSHYLYVEFRNSSNAVVGTAEQSQLGISGDMPEPGDRIVVRVSPQTVPAGATSLRVAHRMAGAGTVRIGRMSARVTG